MTSTIERLPSEILSRIFQIVSHNLGKRAGVEAIHALRLVSRRIKSIATTFLIQDARVGLSTQSFLDFEELCRHPEFRLSIRHVRINVAFYDVQLAEDRRYFCQHCGGVFGFAVELWERHGCRDRRAEGKLKKLWRVADKIREVDNEDFDEASATPHQKIVMNYHKEYQQLTADQEELRRDNDHLRRLCEALMQLPALETIHLDDKDMENQHIFRALNDITIPYDDPRNLTLAIARLMWKGSFVTAKQAQQPLEMLGELLARLGRLNIRPRSIQIELSVPSDARKFQISEEQTNDIHDLVSRAKDVNMNFSGWFRSGASGERNARSISEMSALGSLTRALTTTSTLETLSLTLQDYPALNKFPTVSANVLLPLHTTKWPSLYDLRLSHVPMDMDELVLLVQSQRHTITSLTMQALYLRTGDWDEAIEHLSGLKKLEHVVVKWPYGGRYALRHNHNLRFPEDQACQYILGNSHENPLQAIAELAAS